MIRKTEVKTIRVEYLCDSCSHPVESKVGVTNSWGTVWHHECVNCKRFYTFDIDEQFPRVEYLDLNVIATDDRL